MGATRPRKIWAAAVAIRRNVSIAQGLHVVQLEMMAVVAALEKAVTVATSSRTVGNKIWAAVAAIQRQVRAVVIFLSQTMGAGVEAARAALAAMGLRIAAQRISAAAAECGQKVLGDV